MAQHKDPRFGHAIAEAKKIKARLVDLIPTLTTILGTCRAAYLSNEHLYWSTKMRHDIAERTILLSDEMANVSTLNLLAVCRYAHEIGIWLILAITDEKISLLYGRMLLDSLVERNEDLKRQLEREIDVYDDLARQEAQGFSQAFANATARRKKDPNANIGTELAKEKHEVSAEVDWKHWSKFLLYRKQAVTLGYRFQADRLRSVEIPKAEARLADHAREANAFREHWPNLLQDLGYKKDKDFKWNWKLRADDAGLDQEHDFLYSYVSRLLHAKPSSLSSVPNDLTVDEVLIFQAYTVLRMRVVSNQIEEFVAKQVPH